ncbi:MAG: murein biosynthesis integral membrane protein MurJ [Patescibacteria group bacterium]|nr:murein biosynthesis integral membrane protein MurJ [Patescibacteria group bacterium]
MFKLLITLFFGKQSSIKSAAFILMMSVLCSRILGLARDRLLAGIYPSESLGIYFAAFRIPNMIFDLLITGVLSTAFIPVFTRLLVQKDEDKSWRMASVVMNYGMIFFSLISIPLFLFAYDLSLFLAPGLSHAERTLMVDFTRAIIIFQVFPLVLGSFMTGILQSYELFFIPALAPILYNIGTIIGIIALSSYFGLWAPVIGVIIGSFLFLCIQIPGLLYIKFRYYRTFDTSIDGVKDVGRLMVPRTIGLGVSQIETTIDLSLASILGTKMITVFNFAQHLQQLPIGLFGATIAQAVLPKFSRSSIYDRKDQFRSQVLNAVHQILFFIIPISVLFIVLRVPITRLVFGSSEFDWEATILTSQTLAMFSISLSAQALIQVLARAFYATSDTKTPVVVGILGIILNSILSILFVLILKFPIWGLGLSTSIAMFFHMAILFYLLHRRIGKFSLRDICITPLKILFSSVIMGIFVFGLQRLLDELIFDTTRTINLIIFMGLLCAIAGFIYMFISWVLGIDELYQFLSLLKKFRKVRISTLDEGENL